MVGFKLNNSFPWTKKCYRATGSIDRSCPQMNRRLSYRLLAATATMLLAIMNSAMAETNSEAFKRLAHSLNMMVLSDSALSKPSDRIVFARDLATLKMLMNDLLKEKEGFLLVKGFNQAPIVSAVFKCFHGDEELGETYIEIARRLPSSDIINGRKLYFYALRCQRPGANSDNSDNSYKDKLAELKKKFATIRR